MEFVKLESTVGRKRKYTEVNRKIFSCSQCLYCMKVQSSLDISILERIQSPRKSKQTTGSKADSFPSVYDFGFEFETSQKNQFHEFYTLPDNLNEYEEIEQSKYGFDDY